MIKKLLTVSELKRSVDIIRVSFMTVADDYKITPETAPTNPAFMQLADLLRLKNRDIQMFGIFENEVQCGFVAIERAGAELFYMEKLAVLPDHRHRGYGKRLIDFVCDHVRQLGGSTVGIGIIADNTVLKEWYVRNGFGITGTKSFEHLPFEVCFMAKAV